MYSDIGSETY